MNRSLTQQNFTQSLILSILLLFIYGSKCLLLQNSVSWGVSSDLLLMPLGDLLYDFLLSHKWFSFLLLMLLTLFNGLRLNRVVIRGNFMQDSSHVVSTIYVALSMLSGEVHVALLGQLIASFALSVFERVIQVKKLMNCATKFYGAAFHIGVLSLFVVQTIYFVIPLFFVLLIYKRINLKEMLGLIAGVSLPIFLYLYVNWMLGVSFGDSLAEFGSVLKESLGMSHFQFASWLDYSLISRYYVSILALLSLIVFSFSAMSLKRKYFQSHLFLFYWLVCGAVVISLYNYHIALVSPIIYLPVAVFLLFGFQHIKSDNLVSALYAGLMVATIAHNLY